MFFDSLRLAQRWRLLRGLAPGLLLCAALAALALALAQLPLLARWGLGALTLAIVLGMALGNAAFGPMAAHVASGVDFARSHLLRWGIILYGLRMGFAQLVQVGWAGLLIDLLMVTLTFLLAVQLGLRWLKMDRDTVLLIGAGSAICGAAAVMGTEPVLKAAPHKVSVAVATVVVFGTLAMFVYPLLYAISGMDEHAYGLYVGSTVHEVAQVVVAGSSVGPKAADIAVVEKLLRVMLLAPFLLLLGWGLARRAAAPAGLQAQPQQHPKLLVPWFVVGFIAASAVHSTGWLPAVAVQVLLQIDTLLLACAMAALGLRTQASALRQAGIKPLLLALCLFVFLVLGGYAINAGVQRIFAV